MLDKFKFSSQDYRQWAYNGQCCTSLIQQSNMFLGYRTLHHSPETCLCSKLEMKLMVKAAITTQTVNLQQARGWLDELDTVLFERSWLGGDTELRVFFKLFKKTLLARALQEKPPG